MPAAKGARRRGFTYVELVVAAVVLFIASVGVFQSLAMMVRLTERKQRDLYADQLLRTAVGYLRDVGYESLVALGSAQVASAIASQYATQLRSLGRGAALGVSWRNTLPGSLLDATVSVSWSLDGATQSLSMATRVAKGGPL